MIVPQIVVYRINQFATGVVSVNCMSVAWRVALILAAAAFCTFDAPVARADTPFANLTGTWSGRGQVRIEGGKNERITCKAYYTPKDGGVGVGIALRCASPSYSINLRSLLTSTGDRVTGTWEEETFNANGTVTGRAYNGNLSVSISGGGLAGSMSVSFGSATQQVSINTSGTPLRGVSISLSRM